MMLDNDTDIIIDEHRPIKPIPVEVPPITIDVYTDGSAKGNGTSTSVGGWAFCVVSKGEVIYQSYGGESSTTNQRMELTAAAEALDWLVYLLKPRPEDTITVFSDSAYLINCVNQSWWHNWQKNGWRNAKREPVANQDLWIRLIPYFKCPVIKWSKVKGHAGDKYNEMVDEMAQKAAEARKHWMEVIDK